MKLYVLICFFFFIGSFFTQVNTEKNSIPATNQSEKKEVQDTINSEQKPAVYKKSKITEKPSKDTQSQKISSGLTEQSEIFKSIKADASTQNTQRSPTAYQQNELNKTVLLYEQQAPNSFEFHYFKYVSGAYNVDLIEHLLAAEKLKPNNVDVQIQLAAYHFIKKEDTELKHNLGFLLKTKKIEPEILIYAEHLLTSVEKNGILVTHGFDDSYGVMYLQKVKAKRSDVTLISLDFMQSEYYRNRLKKEGFFIPEGTCIDVTYLKNFCEANTSKRLQLSMTFPSPYFKAIQQNLSILGLTFIYNNQEIDLSESNRKIYENGVKLNQVTNFQTDKCKKLSSNYLPFLLSIRQELQESKKDDQVKEIQSYIDKISIQAKLKQNVKSYR